MHVHKLYNIAFAITVNTRPVAPIRDIGNVPGRRPARQVAVIANGVGSVSTSLLHRNLPFNYQLKIAERTRLGRQKQPLLVPIGREPPGKHSVSIEIVQIGRNKRNDAGEAPSQTPSEKEQIIEDGSETLW
jgi:hypothetical protein